MRRSDMVTTAAVMGAGTAAAVRLLRQWCIRD
jgi:hypothetical protein